ncbi:MAG TPA: bifunctional adenosylcobinamide kinase/adenosylcobinamide-phosphate guanylyltransferase [Anaerolineae bacterium]|nr:bifunctional adenosylcobinamide kinase/adenosylcobinamide-phosphate guanylyltransferase [Anaerolineae bacterium]
MGKLIFILGGARSGKSAYAQQLAEDIEKERDGGVVYIATAEAGDEEMRARIERHRRSRPPGWETVEALTGVAAAVARVGAGRAAVIVDCLTLLMSNLLLAEGEAADREEATRRVLREVEELIEAARAVEADVIVVSNEVGMGVVPPTPLGRLFQDIAGQAHQLLARAADEVYFMLAGLHQRLK